MTTPDPTASMTPEELIEVITRGLDADEQAARAAIPALSCEDGIPVWPDYQTYSGGDLTIAYDYLNRFQPSRVLADVEAKREILAEYKAAGEFYGDRPDAPAGEMTGLYFVLKRLARPCLDQETP